MTFNCRSYIDALSANVQRVYSKTPQKQKAYFLGATKSRPGSTRREQEVTNQSSFSPLILLIVMFIVSWGSSPPSSGLGEGIAGHRIASSFEVLRRI